MANRYPQRPNAHQIEEVSERFFKNCLPRNWHCEKPGGDYGVDLRVDIFEGEEVTGLELLVQLKASSHTAEGDSETITLRTATYNYLWDKLQVVMVVKYVEPDQEGYWLLLKDVPKPNQGSKTIAVKISKANRLTTIDWQRIQDYVREITDEKLAARRRNDFQGQ